MITKTLTIHMGSAWMKGCEDAQTVFLSLFIYALPFKMCVYMCGVCVRGGGGGGGGDLCPAI